MFPEELFSSLFIGIIIISFIFSFNFFYNDFLDVSFLSLAKAESIGCADKAFFDGVIPEKSGRIGTTRYILDNEIKRVDVYAGTG